MRNAKGGVGLYEWDEAKRAFNLAKHGVDFAAVYEADWALGVTGAHQVGEELRFLTYLPIRGRVHAIVWTAREGATRIISLSKANERETKAHARARSGL